MDKYEKELEEAIVKAVFIPKEYWNRIAGFRFIGTAITPYGNRHYYKDESQGKYYYESDFDREMRRIIKRNRVKKYGKN